MGGNQIKIISFFTFVLYCFIFSSYRLSTLDT